MALQSNVDLEVIVAPVHPNSTLRFRFAWERAQDGEDKLRPAEHLRSLRLILGGRDDIAEVNHSALESLEIIQIRSFWRFDPARFPNLQQLLLGDQRQLEWLNFGDCAAPLTRLQVGNCKNLQTIAGLGLLERLLELRLFRTAIDFDDLLAKGLPKELRTFAFGTGKATLDRHIQAKLVTLGYQKARI